ncbi:MULTISPECIES: YwiC-like family protein [unclassified Leptolyngbya]|uniref:YwiC-like family protein n=1 Tax=unclassified Leptolyngbya TaxID=2650499 RepID=UPI001683AB13|nr:MULTISPECIES: YwiC-like family protein [unclassified Leptolyngbya]MBD1909824.1 YwiC-like family protein [Leptolyngbya sp. FACHB-8]MBD2158975.1 YwiC-like family protein [Leptolyngbya sp. FACHB-16]
MDASTQNQTPTLSPAHKPNAQVWYRPVFSHDHGVYIMLLVSFLTGAAAAQQWSWVTTLALICAFCGFQAEHPWALQIKQRRSLKPRFLFWGSLYSSVAGAIALYLYWLQGAWSPLLWIYLGAIAAFLIDVVSVFFREQKSALNELITFAAVCLCAPLAYTVTTGSFTISVLGLWILNTLFFSSAIFTVKFRKDKSHSVMPSLVYHAIATLAVTGLWSIGWLSPITALSFGVVLLKYGIIFFKRDWYCTTNIKYVAMLETGSALLFLAVATLSLLPAYR